MNKNTIVKVRGVGGWQGMVKDFKKKKLGPFPKRTVYSLVPVPSAHSFVWSVSHRLCFVDRISWSGSRGASLVERILWTIFVERVSWSMS